MQSFEHVHAVRKSDWRGSSRKQLRRLLLSSSTQQVLLTQPVIVAQPVLLTQPVIVAQPVLLTQPVGVGTGALALSLCNECNECNEFADGTRYILVTLSSLVRATFTECNECNEFVSRFLLAEEKRGEGRGRRKFRAFYSLHSLHSRNRPLTRGKTVTKVVTSCNQSGRNSLHSVTRVGDFAHVSGSSP